MRKAKKDHSGIDYQSMIERLKEKTEKAIEENNKQIKRIKKEIGKPSPPTKLPKCFDIFDI